MNARWLRVGTGAVHLFAGAMAVAGGVGLVGGGIRFPLDWLRGTPFSNYTRPGLILGIVVGGSALTATVVTLTARRDVGALAAGAAGAIVLGWIVGEYALVGAVSWMQPVTLGYGLGMAGMARALALPATRQTSHPRTWARRAA